MSLEGGQTFAFIPVDGHVGKPKAKDRRLIRSHCMSGRNLRIGVHPVPDEWAEEQQRQNEAQARLPPPGPSDLSLVPFAGDVDASSRKLIFDFYTKSRETLYPVGISVNETPENRTWLQWLTQFAEYTHPVLFGISATCCIISDNPFGSETRYHLGKTLHCLKERLSNRDLAVHDSTIWLVMALAIFFSCKRDYAAAEVHVKGLGQLVRLRGGLESLRHQTRLYTKLGRLDLSYALHSGSKPVFLTETTPLDPGLLDCWSGVRPPGAPSIPQPVADLDKGQLVAVFKKFQQTAHLLNDGADNHDLLGASEFQSRICSMQYRLLSLQGSLENTPAECLRLAMLALLTTTFQVRGSESRYPYLAERFRESCGAVDCSTPPMPGLMLWLLMVGAVSLSAAKEPWLREQWRAEMFQKLTWDEARPQLKAIIWIDGVHDQAGRQAFDLLSMNDVAETILDMPLVKSWDCGWAGTSFEFNHGNAGA